MGGNSKILPFEVDFLMGFHLKSPMTKTKKNLVKEELMVVIKEHFHYMTKYCQPWERLNGSLFDFINFMNWFVNLVIRVIYPLYIFYEKTGSIFSEVLAFQMVIKSLEINQLFWYKFLKYIVAPFLTLLLTPLEQKLVNY